MRYVIGVLLLAAQPAAAQPVPAGGANPPLRGGPLRVRFATAASDVIADTTVRMMKEIPGAIAESVRNGNFKLTYQFSVTPGGPLPAEAVPAPPVRITPAPTPQPRRLFPRR